MADTDERTAADITEDEYEPIFIFDDEDHSDDPSDEPAIRGIHAEAAKEIAAEPKDDTPREPEKRTFGTFVENLIYHHKFGIFLTCFILFVVIIVILDFLPKHHDMEIPLYASGQQLSQEAGELNDILSPYCPDVDGDGKQIVNCSFYDRTSDDYTLTIAAAAFMIAEYDNTYNCMLIVTDKAHYDLLVENYGEEIFQSLDGAPKWIPSGGCPIFDEFIRRNDVSVELGFSLLAIPDALKDDEKAIARHDAAEQMLRNILTEYPELTVSPSDSQ